MLISHVKKFIFFKPVKTAGTSVEAALSQYCGPVNEVKERSDSLVSSMGLITARFGGFHNGVRLHEHIHPLRAQRSIPANVWSSYYKFCTVRNPFDRFISLYFWTIQPDQFQHPWNYELTDEESKSYKLVFKKEKLREYRRDFEKCLIRMEARPKGSQAWSWIWLQDRLLDDYFHNSQFVLDDFIRYEHLEEDLKRICSHLQIEVPALPQFKCGVRPSWATPENMYTVTSRSIIERFCHNEIERFCYSFPKPAIKL